MAIIDIEPAKGAQSLSVARNEEAVGWIDIVHVIHETEWSITFDNVTAVHPGDGLGGKAPDIARAGLVTAIEVLASKFCDADRQLESRVPVLLVGLEV